ncbi:MAG TPA: YggT family protein [Caulobacteraceae bacterium]|jgi:YggT family protein|nr:YggT family protein [Caulobacteraceae bacterium]
MAALIDFVFVILYLLIEAVIWLIIAWAIMTWLVQFDVINMRNRIASQVFYFLERINRPILRPVSRIIPTLGGIDISPMIVIIVLVATERALLPPLHSWLISLVTPGLS